MMTAMPNCRAEGCDGACVDFGGGIVAEELGLLTDGAFRRVTGLALAGVGGEGGGIEPFTSGSALLLEIECDLARRDRGIVQLVRREKW